METIIKNKWGYFVFFCLSLVTLYIVVNNYFDNSTKENFRYSIATLTEVNFMGKSSLNKIKFNYSYNKNIYKGSHYFDNDSTSYYDSKIGKRFLVKINNNEWVNKLFSTSRLYINKPVPDSIKEAPSEGWKELPTWAK